MIMDIIKISYEEMLKKLDQLDGEFNELKKKKIDTT